MAGSDDLDDAFIKEHQDFVERLVDRTVSSLRLIGERDEFVAAGMEGLITARKRYDPERGAAFRTFAYYRVRGAIIDHARQASNLSRAVYTSLRAAAGADAAAEAAGEEVRPPGIAGMSDSVSALGQGLLQAAAAFMVSESSHKLSEEGSDAALESASLKEQIRKHVEQLPEREKALVKGFYFEDRSLEEVGEELGVSKSWASRLHSRALERIRAAMAK